MRLALDFSEVLSDENVKGAMYVFNASSEQELISILGNNFIREVDEVVKRHNHIEKVVGANISPVENEQPQQQQYQESEVPETAEDYPVEYVNDDSVVEAEEDSIVDNHLLVGNEEQDLDQNYLNMLVDMVRNDIFEIEAFVGHINALYVSDYDTYASKLESVFDMDIRPLGEAPESDLTDVDYILEFKDLSGKVRYGKKSFKKIKEEMTKEKGNNNG